jgi:hypothetical protein
MHCMFPVPIVLSHWINTTGTDNKRLDANNSGYCRSKFEKYVYMTDDMKHGCDWDICNAASEFIMWNMFYNKLIQILQATRSSIFRDFLSILVQEECRETIHLETTCNTYYQYWLQIQRSGFDSWRYQIFWEVVGLEQDPLSLVSTIEQLLRRNGSGSGLESQEYDHTDPLHWPRGTF